MSKYLHFASYVTYLCTHLVVRLHDRIRYGTLPPIKRQKAKEFDMDGQWSHGTNDQPNGDVNNPRLNNESAGSFGIHRVWVAKCLEIRQREVIHSTYPSFSTVPRITNRQIGVVTDDK